MLNIRIHEGRTPSRIPSGVTLYMPHNDTDARKAMVALRGLYPESPEHDMGFTSVFDGGEFVVHVSGSFDKVSAVVSDYMKAGIKKLMNTPGTDKERWLDAWFTADENLKLYTGTHIGSMLEESLLELSDIDGVVWVELRDSGTRYGRGIVLMSKDSVDAVNGYLDGKYIQVRDVYYFTTQRGAEWFSSKQAVLDAQEQGLDYTDLYGVVLEMYGSDLRDKTRGSQFRIRDSMASRYEPLGR